MTLWRSRLDDTDRQQLTFPPMEARSPRWSRDGEKLVINARFPGKPWKLYIIPAKGGSPEQLIPGPESESFPDWSPDGRQIVFGGSPFFEPGITEPNGLYLFDLASKSVTRIPGSEGLFGATWSPDGRLLVALRLDFSKLMLLDTTSGKWEELATGVLHFANWSSDGQYPVLRALGRRHRSDAHPHQRSARGEDRIVEGIPADGWTGAMLERPDAGQRTPGVARYRDPGNLRA